MLTGGYQLIDLTGTTWTDHETYYDCTDAFGVELGAKVAKAITKVERMEIVVGGTIKLVHGEDDVETIALPVLPCSAMYDENLYVVQLPDGTVLAETNYLMASTEGGMAIVASLA